MKSITDPGFLRRLKFYLIGFLLGLVLVNFLFKGRGCKMPGSIKLEELSGQEIIYTKHAACRMQCRAISAEEIKQVLETGNINYSKSNAQDKPCPSYAVEGTTKDAQKVRIVIADCDTVSKVVTAIDLGLEQDTCHCSP